jgi:hypothetical protein
MVERQGMWFRKGELSPRKPAETPLKHLSDSNSLITNGTVRQSQNFNRKIFSLFLSR